MEEKIRLQRIRMLSALGDFQLALSAADFLQVADEDECYDRVELRRFKCYEQTAIISYARPFSESKGGTPKLSLKHCGVKLSPPEIAFHERIIHLRNKLVAHSDPELMNFTATTFDLGDSIRTLFFALFPQHDEGLQLHSFWDQIHLIDLIRKVSFTLYDTMHKIAQDEPAAFNIKMSPSGRA